MKYVSLDINRTVFTEKIPATLSHSDPLFGSQFNSFANALASASTRCFTSLAVYPRPVMPQTNGFLAVSSGARPYWSLRMKSLMGIESGIESAEKCGIHGGGVKTIDRDGQQERIESSKVRR
jgi:hypothetical protein